MFQSFKFGLLALTAGAVIFAAPVREDAMQEVLKIAHGISVVQPSLADAEYVSYAIGIHRAAKRYGIHPSVLISITQQESGFRANLPEGPAGELGICQIIKSWLKNPRFIAHFGNMTQADLKKPATSFRVAAWILADLKDSSLAGPLPFWSFYNSREFKNRFKYFLKVTRNLAALRKRAPTVYSDTALVAASDQPKLNRAARRELASQNLPNAVRSARMLQPKRLAVRQKLADQLVKTASINDGLDYNKPVSD